MVYMKSNEYQAERNWEQGKENRILTVGTSSADGLQDLSEQFSWLQIKLILEKHCPWPHYLVCNIEELGGKKK